MKILVAIGFVLFPYFCFAGTWIEDRERLVKEEVVNVGECESDVTEMGRLSLTVIRAFMATQERYESYQVQVVQAGTFAEKIETLIQDSKVQYDRMRMEKKTFKDMPSCSFWVETHKDLLGKKEQAPQ